MDTMDIIDGMDAQKTRGGPAAAVREAESKFMSWRMGAPFFSGPRGFVKRAVLG
jgi:hypothetical protein